MAQINFPAQPALQNPNNTYSPTSTPFASKNGVTYLYNNGVWASSTDAAFVRTSGDHMSGNLSLGSTDGLTNELYLRNSTGQIISGQYNFNSDQVFGTSIIPGGITVQKNATAAVNDKAISVYHGSYLQETFTVFVDGTVRAKNMEFSGDLALGGDKIQFDSSDGSASFAGSVDCGGLNTLNYQQGVKLETTAGNSTCTVYGDSRSAAPSFVVFDGQDAVSTRASINKDGSASFAGNVTLGLGSDKITLDATTGGASFAGGNATVASDGEAVFGDYYNTAGARILPRGEVSIREDADNAAVFGVYLNGLTTADNTIAFLSSGASTFKGEMNLGDVYTGNGTRFLPRGEVYVRQDNPTAGVFNVVSGGTAVGNSTITFLASGEASFGGTINAANTSTAGNAIVIGNNNQAVLRADGSADFTGQITHVSPSAGSGGIQAFGVYGLGDATAVASIKTDGSADFMGRIKIGEPSTTATANALLVYGGGTGPNVTITAAGVSQFNKRLTSGISTLADRAIVAANNTSAGNGGTISAFQYNGTGEVWNGFNVGTQTSTITADGTISGKNVTFNLEADDDTKYTSTTSSEGVVTRVYNGTVLNVKDRLEKTQTALQALKTAAADNSTDLVGLKSAILSALANI